MDCCILCLEKEIVADSSKFEYLEDYLYEKFEKENIACKFIEIFGNEGLQLCMNEILTLHFPLELNLAQTADQRICRICWQTVKNFHLLYEKVYTLMENKSFQYSSIINHYSEQKNHGLLLPALEETLPLKRLRGRPRKLNCKQNGKLKEIACNNFLEKGNHDNLLDKMEKIECTETEGKGLVKTNEEQLEISEIIIKEKTQSIHVNKRSQDMEIASNLESLLKVEGTTDNTLRSQELEKIGSNQIMELNALKKRSISYRRQLTLRTRKLFNKSQKRTELKPLSKKYLSRAVSQTRKVQCNEYEMIIRRFFQENLMHCPKCHLPVNDFDGVKEHFRLIHDDDHGYVECCGKRFKTRKTIAEHIKVHYNPDHFKCSTCNKICLDSKELLQHQNTHRPELLKQKKLFQCNKCTKTFSSKASLEYHSFAIHVPKDQFQYQCDECLKKLPTDRKLREHLRKIHNPQNSLICDKCGKIFRNSYNLKKHNETEHSLQPKPPPEPQQCPICGTWLRHLLGLKQHLKSIHEESPKEHRCHICNKVSSTARALKRHIYHNHECSKKFQCTMCEKAFKRGQDLREHTSVHTGEVLYTCPNCPMTFFSNANMYKHRQRLHRSEWEADRQQPIPPNIMGQAKQSSKLNKLKKLSVIFNDGGNSEKDTEIIQ